MPLLAPALRRPARRLDKAISVDGRTLWALSATTARYRCAGPIPELYRNGSDKGTATLRPALLRSTDMWPDVAVGGDRAVRSHRERDRSLVGRREHAGAVLLGAPGRARPLDAA
jgi:hypothetical protein